MGVMKVWRALPPLLLLLVVVIVIRGCMSNKARRWVADRGDVKEGEKELEEEGGVLVPDAAMVVAVVVVVGIVVGSIKCVFVDRPVDNGSGTGAGTGTGSGSGTGGV